MKCNLWTLALLGAGVVTLPSVLKADEKVTATPVLTALSSTTISGYVDTSAQWNIGSGNALVPPYAFSAGKADGFNLNVVKLTIEKPIDPADGWGAGYKADLIFGPDANSLATQSGGTAADFAVKQAYVTLHAPVLPNGLDFKIGVWDTIIGYEVFEAGNNPNYTRSYGYTIEPTTHTGVLVSYQFCEMFSANFGIANTLGPKINERANPPRAESYKTYMGSFTLTAPTNMAFLAGSTLTGCIINGYNSGLGADETSFYIGATLATPVTGLKVGACYDYLGVSSQPVSGAGYANAVGVYASFQATEKLGFYGRAEYASSDIGLIGAHRVVELTSTIQYDLWKNVLSRLELRWDHAADGSKAYGDIITDGVGDFVSGTKKNSVILAANIIYKF